METVALESDGKQVERSRNGTKRLKIVQKAFSHFFVFSTATPEGGYSCPNSPGTPLQLFAVLRRQPNFAEKSVIASVSGSEQRPFKPPQLPALRAVVTALAPERRQDFLLLFLSTPAFSFDPRFISGNMDICRRKCAQSLGKPSCYLAI